MPPRTEGAYGETLTHIFSLLSLIRSLILQPTEMLMLPPCTRHFVEFFELQRETFFSLSCPWKLLPLFKAQFNSLLLPKALGGLFFCIVQQLWSLGSMDTYPWFSPSLLTNELQEGWEMGWNSFPMTSYVPVTRPETKSIAKMFSHKCHSHCTSFSLNKIELSFWLLQPKTYNGSYVFPWL